MGYQTDQPPISYFERDENEIIVLLRLADEDFNFGIVRLGRGMRHRGLTLSKNTKATLKYCYVCMYEGLSSAALSSLHNAIHPPEAMLEINLRRVAARVAARVAGE